MKNEPIRYLGLEVHRSTALASVRDEQGKRQIIGVRGTALIFAASWEQSFVLFTAQSIRFTSSSRGALHQRPTRD